MYDERIAGELFRRWQELNLRVEESVLEGDMERAMKTHVRRDEVVMLSVRLGVSGILDRMVDDSGIKVALAVEPMTYWDRRKHEHTC